MINELKKEDVIVTHGDVSRSFKNKAIEIGSVSVDIETSGLDWKNDKIGSVQVMIPGVKACVVRVGEKRPKNICNIIREKEITKIFHHALFDLRFMSYNWEVDCSDIRCTKIASKILNTGDISHSLKDILERRRGINMDKSLQKSNWLAKELSDDQILYAVKDVFYLKSIFDLLVKDLRSCGRYKLAKESFEYIPTRVSLDIIGAEDVFTY
jgi:ribonuclease D